MRRAVIVRLPFCASILGRFFCKSRLTRTYFCKQEPRIAIEPWLSCTSQEKRFCENASHIWRNFVKNNIDFPGILCDNIYKGR